MKENWDEIQEVTKELLDSMDSFDRTETLMKYHDWLNKVRTQDKDDARRQANKIYNFKNPEIIKKIKEKQRIKRRELNKKNRTRKFESKELYISNSIRVRCITYKTVTGFIDRLYPSRRKK